MKQMIPSLTEAKELAKGAEGRLIPVALTLFSDCATPVGLLQILKAKSSHCFLLESVEGGRRWSRYSLLGFSPKLELTCHDCVVTLKGYRNETIRTDAPAEVVREVLKEHKSCPVPGMPPFTGGLVGSFAYDYIRYVEPVLQQTEPKDDCWKELDLMLFDQVAVFDHEKQQLFLICHIPSDRVEEAYPKAEEQLKELAYLVQRGAKKQFLPPKRLTPFQPLFSKEEFCQMVERAKEYIKEGDIFQVVLSNRLTAGFCGSLFDVYRVLRTTNPSPYMFYFVSDQLELAGASPETLVKVINGKAYTYPLAGSRPRGKTEEGDKALEQELLADEKENAEHNMLVDLGRNDMGKISRFGTVQVEQYRTVEKYSHIMHIGSTVSGQLREDCDAMDAIHAILPAGTLSGAPKIRACQIIQELEGENRGVYGGAIGYLDFNGNLDTCIAIRLAYAKDGKLHIRSGAGIVYDSVPEKEFEECINKAKAVVEAVEQAEEGIL